MSQWSGVEEEVCMSMKMKVCLDVCMRAKLSLGLLFNGGGLK
jgi:hypothetical protein